MYGIYQLNTKYISQIGERSFNCWSVLANLADTPSKNLSTDTRLSIVYGPSLIANWILFWQPRYFKLKNQVPSQVQIEIGHRTDKAKDKEKERSLFRAPVKWSNYTDYPLLKPTSIGGNDKHHLKDVAAGAQDDTVGGILLAVHQEHYVRHQLFGIQVGDLVKHTIRIDHLVGQEILTELVILFKELQGDKLF